MSAEFWNMSGYGLWVWGSFGSAAVVYLWNWLTPRWQRRAALNEALDE